MHRFLETLRVLRRVRLVGMHRVPVTTQRHHANALVFKFLLPRFRLRLVGDQFIQRAMRIVRISAGSDLHRFYAECGEHIEHLIERQIVVHRIKHTDRKLFLRAAALPARSIRTLSAHRSTPKTRQRRGNRVARRSRRNPRHRSRRQQPASGRRQKLPPVDVRFVPLAVLQGRLRGTFK